MKKNIALSLLIVLCVFACIGIILLIASIFLFVAGYRPIVAPDAEPNWDAVMVFVTLFGSILIPIVIAVAQWRITKGQKELEKSNERHIEELQNFNEKYQDSIDAMNKVVSRESAVILDGGNAGGWED